MDKVKLRKIQYLINFLQNCGCVIESCKRVGTGSTFVYIAHPGRARFLTSSGG